MKNLLKYLIIILISSQTFAQKTEVIIDAKIDSNLKLVASIEYLFTATQDSVKVFKHSAGKDLNNNPNIKITKITSNGKKVAYNDFDKWVIINDVKNLKHLKVEYHLDLNAIYDWRKSYGYAIFPGTYEDKCWYPDVYIDGKRDFHKDFSVTIKHPKKLKLLTSGTLEKSVKKGKLLVDSFKVKNVRYYGLNAGWDFVNERISNGSVSLNYFCPKDKKETYKNVAEIAIKAVDWYIEKYGFFPKKEMSIAMGHPRWHGGFPSENMFYIHQGNLEKSHVEWVTAHELGHYYWGLHTLSSTDDELSPLMLANGIWIDHLYLADAYNKSFTQIWNEFTPQAAMIEKYLATCLANYEQEIGFTAAQQNFGFDYNSNVAHGKASLGLYLISQTIGTEAFFKLQKEILQRFNGKPFSIQDFKTLLIEKGYNYSAKFIDEWYKDHAFIEYGIYKVKTEKEGVQWNYTFELRNKGTVNFPVDIRIIDENGKTYNLISDGLSKKQVFKGTTQAKPSQFLLDVDGKLPMWNSDNKAIQKAYIFALYRAGKIKIANQLAKVHLSKNPEDTRLKRFYDTFSK